MSVIFQGQGSLRPGARLRRRCHWATVIPRSAGHRAGGSQLQPGRWSGEGHRQHEKGKLPEEEPTRCYWGPPTCVSAPEAGVAGAAPAWSPGHTDWHNFTSSSPQAFWLLDIPLVPDSLSQQLLCPPTPLPPIFPIVPISG